MKIHYNNGAAEKIIDHVIAIQVVDQNHPVVAVLENGKELTISLNNIEMILDDEVGGKKPC